ncbi:alpha/beta hydrolase fold domain-containing protein [Streptomyces sp. NPDC050617]|uniref:alpha/beta hydrolase fold domain-containing protein n=1 Tax=Streptomyces sp. NPDC050617 TaxID=3154628 RepID=UPI0034455F8E
MAVAGGSAGGNLAAATALRARDLDGPYVAFQALTYPGLDAGATSASMREFTDTPVLNRAAMRQGWQYYAPRSHSAPYASPLRADDLDGLPPTYVAVAEVDPLRAALHRRQTPSPPACSGASAHPPASGAAALGLPPPSRSALRVRPGGVRWGWAAYR